MQRASSDLSERLAGSQNSLPLGSSMRPSTENVHACAVLCADPGWASCRGKTVLDPVGIYGSLQVRLALSSSLP